MWLVLWSQLSSHDHGSQAPTAHPDPSSGVLAHCCEGGHPAPSQTELLTLPQTASCTRYHHPCSLSCPKAGAPPGSSSLIPESCWAPLPAYLKALCLPAPAAPTLSAAHRSPASSGPGLPLQPRAPLQTPHTPPKAPASCFSLLPLCPAASGRPSLCTCPPAGPAPGSATGSLHSPRRSAGGQGGSACAEPSSAPCQLLGPRQVHGARVPITGQREQ